MKGDLRLVEAGNPSELWHALAAQYGLEAEAVERKAKVAYSWRGAIPVWENCSEEVRDFMRYQTVLAVVTE